jgi:hypothetical protein
MHQNNAPTTNYEPLPHHTTAHRTAPQGYRDTQKAIVDIAERAAEVDQIKGSTLEEISQMVEQINREFKNKQAQLQPLIAELKV